MRTCWVRVFSILSFFPPLKRTWAYFSAVRGKVIQAPARVEMENLMKSINLGGGSMAILQVRCLTCTIHSELGPLVRSFFSSYLRALTFD
jgi:hypothetical protein